MLFKVRAEIALVEGLEAGQMRPNMPSPTEAGYVGRASGLGEFHPLGQCITVPLRLTITGSVRTQPANNPGGDGIDPSVAGAEGGQGWGQKRGVNP